MLLKYSNIFLKTFPYFESSCLCRGEEKNEDPDELNVKDIYGYASESPKLPPLAPVKPSHKKIATFLAVLCFIFLLGIIILAILCK